MWLENKPRQETNTILKPSLQTSKPEDIQREEMENPKLPKTFAESLKSEHVEVNTWWNPYAPGTVSTVEDAWVGRFIIVKEVLCLLCDAAFLKHGIWYVIFRWLRWK